MSLKTKILSILFLSFSILVINNFVEQYRKYQESIKFIKANLATDLNHSFSNNLEQQLHYLGLSLETLLLDETVVKLFAERKRQALADKLKNYYQNLKIDYGVAQFQFHRPDAHSFLRLHRLDKYDDDLSSFRRTVVSANHNQKPIKSFEVGRGELGTRVVYPVSYQGKHIGSVELGGSAINVVEQLKQTFKVEYAVGIKQSIFKQAKRFEQRDSDILVSDVIFHAFSNESVAQVVRQYQSNQDEYVINGRLHITFRIPLYDFSKQYIGYIIVVKDLQDIQDDAFATFWQSFITGTLIALITFALLWLVMSLAVSRPLSKAVKVANSIADGDLSVKIETQGNDEIHHLLRIIDEVLIQQIKKIIFETRSALQSLSQGDFSVRIKGDFAGDFAAIKQATNETAEKLQHLVNENSVVLQRLASGDMEARIESDFPGEFAEIKRATNDNAATLQALIDETNDTFAHLSNGQLAARINSDFPGRFATIKSATNAMANDLQALISETSAALAQLAKGDMDINVELEYTGDFREIKRALEITANKLNQAISENERQNWLKSGQNDLNKQTSGEKNLQTLAEDIINFLTPYLGAQVGAFYLWEETADFAGEASNTKIERSGQLRMLASHAYIFRKNAKHTFNVGEGIVGQAALECKPFIIQQTPEDYISIQSGLGTGTPRAILVAPFMYENQIKGVIELASFEPLEELHLAFLDQVLPVIGIAVNVAQSRTHMKELLEQTQTQAKALTEQQLELQNTNEELQSQTEELQAQQEELKAQQEELRQTNEELEARTRDVERQSMEVQEKNNALEKVKVTLQNKAEELELASKYKSEFLANMSHELRTPLNSMLILGRLMAENPDQNLTEKQIEYANTIYSAGNDLLLLINDILDLSKVEAGKIEIIPEKVEVVDLFQSLEQKFRPLTEQKNIDFNLELAIDLPATISTDGQRLKQVLTNLLANAVKFTEQGSVTVRVQCSHMDGGQATDKLAISIIDTGIGIPEDKQKVVFEAFQQADGATTRRFGGTGLGLSISRQLAHLLGGEITLQSEVGKGSTFTLYINTQLSAIHEESGQRSPLVSLPNLPTYSTTLSTPTMTNALQGTTQVEETVAQSHDSPGLTESVLVDDRDDLQDADKVLLVIEDEVNFAQILYNIAQEKHFKCLLANDGQQGLQLAAQYQPSAIILDLGLPQIDGWSVMEQLKNNLNTRHIPVHFISGSDYSKNAKQMGAIGYSLKPVSMDELNQAFGKIDHFISKTERDLLLVTDNHETETNVCAVVGAGQIRTTIVDSCEHAWQQLHTHEFDCIVIDVNLRDNSGLPLLEQIRQEPDINQIPLITYGQRALTPEEEKIVRTCGDTLVVKEVHSQERLLDEVTLFLHQVEDQLSQEQQQMLQRIRNKEMLLQNKKVLLVDDDMRNVFALGAALEKKGMEVIVANNGKEALQVLEEHSDTAVVLMDIMMPEMDGYEATRKIRERQAFNKLPIIALTAKAMKGDKAKCIEAGANDYLAKPIDADKLVSLMRVWLYE